MSTLYMPVTAPVLTLDQMQAELNKAYANRSSDKATWARWLGRVATERRRLEAVKASADKAAGK